MIQKYANYERPTRHNRPMETNLITISLQDDSPGYEISPARVPLATLAAFASEVRDFLKGSGKDGDTGRCPIRS
ncbi:MAG: hypothetical protein VB141_08755 [Burkholderia gladioli]